MPLAIGNSWTRDEIDEATGAVQTETATVELFGDIGGEKAGTSAFKLRHVSESGRVKETWEEDRGIVVLRHLERKYALDGSVTHESYYVPSKLIVDMQAERLQQGQTYTESYQVKDIDPVTGTEITTHNVVWTVEATNAMVTSTAGTFSCLQLHRVSSGGGATPSDKSYWFSQNVGKVKIDEPGNQIELLRSYDIP